MSFPAGTYVGIELEVGQRHVSQTGRHWPGPAQTDCGIALRVAARRCAETSA